MLRGQPETCYANFSLLEFRFIPLSQHDSCLFSSETHLTKCVIWGFYTTNSCVSISIAISGDYMIKVSDCSTSTTTLINTRKSHTKWMKTASTFNSWGGGTHNIFGWECAARSWKPLPYFRQKNTIFCHFGPDSQNVYPISDPVMCDNFGNSQ